VLKYLIYIHIVVLILSINGCAQKSEAHVKFETDRMMHDLFILKECRIKSTEKLDDGISSAKTIAISVIKDCSKESKAVMNKNMSDKSDVYRESFRNQMNSVETSGVLSIILKHRSQKLKKIKF